jgi:hypothetical protein
MNLQNEAAKYDLNDPENNPENIPTIRARGHG